MLINSNCFHKERIFFIETIKNNHLPKFNWHRVARRFQKRSILCYLLFFVIDCSLLFIILCHLFFIYCSLSFIVMFHLLFFVIYCSLLFINICYLLFFVIYCSMLFIVLCNLLFFVIYCSLLFIVAGDKKSHRTKDKPGSKVRCYLNSKKRNNIMYYIMYNMMYTIILCMILCMQQYYVQ